MKFSKRMLTVLLWITNFVLFLALVDFTRTCFNRSPIFARCIAVYQDGGSAEYVGIGYKVIKYANIENWYEYNFVFPWTEFDASKRRACVSDLISLYLEENGINQSRILSKSDDFYFVGNENESKVLKCKIDYSETDSPVLFIYSGDTLMSKVRFVQDYSKGWKIVENDSLISE